MKQKIRDWLICRLHYEYVCINKDCTQFFLFSHVAWTFTVLVSSSGCLNFLRLIIYQWEHWTLWSSLAKIQMMLTALCWFLFLFSETFFSHQSKLTLCTTVYANLSSKNLNRQSFLLSFSSKYSYVENLCKISSPELAILSMEIYHWTSPRLNLCLSSE